MFDNSALNSRLDYDNAIVMLIKANLINNGEVPTKERILQLKEKVNHDEITQGYLWTEATLSPATQSIQWPIVDTQQVANSPITPTMRLLTMQDSFLISSMSYFLMNYTYVTGTNQASVDFSTRSHFAPITYSATFENNASDEAMAPGCDMFWIGSYISFEVNKRKLIPYWDTYRHYKAPVMQAVTSSYTPNSLRGFQSAHDGSVDGFFPVQPNIVIGGGRGNILKLNLAANIPSMVPFTVAEYNVTYVLKAVLCMRGILMQNSTTLK